MRTYVREGATVDQAIAIALEKLQASPSDVDIEILQEPRKGILGRIKANAVVSVTRKASEENDHHAVQAVHRNGTIRIENGKVHYEPPQGDGQSPKLTIEQGITVKYKGELLLKEVELDQGLDSLEIILPEDQTPDVNTQIKVENDGLVAYFIWEKIPGMRFSLTDMPAAFRGKLKLKRTMVPPPALTMQTVKKHLELEAITHGLDLSVISDEKLAQSSGKIKIAQGTAPIQPINAKIDYIFQNKNPEIDLDSLRIDHYETWGITSVAAGTTLAKKTPAQNGEPGIDVYGKALPSRSANDVDLKYGDGVEISDDGLIATAAAAGLPQLIQGVLVVQSILELNSDADISTGNLVFDGAIVIHGNVLENVKVESATGTIHVDGLVSGADLSCKGNILVRKNVVSSRLTAGGIAVIQQHIATKLHNISEQLRQLITAYHSVAQQNTDLKPNLLISHLLDLKFKSLPKKVKSLADYFATVATRLTPSLYELIAGLMVSFGGSSSNEISNILVVEQLHNAAKAQQDFLESESAIGSDINVRYLQNSSVEASGFVIIEGQGAYYSNVMAGKGLRVERGIFRGGEIRVNAGNVIAKELGGPTGIATSVDITTLGRIVAQTVHSNVKVSIGQIPFMFGETYSQVEVYLSQGELVVTSKKVKIFG